ncbi:hypothetical protein EDD76_102229 [Kineothrix alysoides]|uniref:Uncharacterized protein n=1 Tax=Kineothrix alysoides TaxID=1469948 RepID=A0A4R1R4U8_9FIRM|nr:hypothetical protein [Kineothrix alysoides]TCL60531.1 hypothetical protein EDD76_102229 [Kineothrix alysoides]
MISVESLLALLNIMEATESVVTKNQIVQLLKPQEFTQLDRLVELIFPPKDYATVEERITNKVSIVEIPPLPDMNLKVGAFIKTAMRQLSDSGYVFSKQQLEKLTSKEWSKQTFNTNWPFVQIYSPNEHNGITDANGRVRYWTGLFSFGDVKLYVTKELYLKDHNKEKFVEWYKTLEAAL